MMMVFDHNSLVRQKKGAQGEEEEEVGGGRKADLTGTPTPDADAPIGPTWSRVSDARNRRKHGRWCGKLIRRRGRGARDQSYPLTIGMEVPSERRTKL